jgi:hypothetical protein
MARTVLPRCRARFFSSPPYLNLSDFCWVDNRSKLHISDRSEILVVRLCPRSIYQKVIIIENKSLSKKFWAKHSSESNFVAASKQRFATARRRAAISRRFTRKRQCCLLTSWPSSDSVRSSGKSAWIATLRRHTLKRALHSRWPTHAPSSITSLQSENRPLMQ